MSLFQNRTVLVIRPGALGDAVLTLPVLSALRRAGARKVIVLGQPSSWRYISRDCSWIEKEDSGSVEWLGLYAAEAAFSARVDALLNEVSVAVAYLGDGNRVGQQVLKRKSIVTLLGEVPVWRNVVESSSEPQDYSRDSIQLYGAEVESRHAARMLLRPVIDSGSFPKDTSCATPNEALEASALRLEELPLFTRSDVERSVAWRDLSMRLQEIELVKNKYVVLHPGSGGLRKCWPAERFVKLAESIRNETNCLPLILWGPADGVSRTSFLEAVGARNSFYEILDFSIREVQTLLDRAAMFIGNDAGVSHFAARLCKTLALFGPTDPCRWRPIGPVVSVIQSSSSQMEGITVVQVFSEVQRLLAI